MGPESLEGILESQPELYRKLLPNFFAHAQIPRETKATCSNCAMCPSSGADHGIESAEHAKQFFNPSTKCCTYHPSLPNYLVGAILADQSEGGKEGLTRIERKLTERQGVTPYGVSAPPKYNFLYRNNKDFFGRSEAMLCPYFVQERGGLCSIWRYRDSVCATYFCKYVAGAEGRRFWSSYKTYLALLEAQLARYATLQLYPEYVIDEKHPGDNIETSGPAELEDAAPHDADYSTWWGSWKGMERDYYLECYRIVSALTPEQVQAILGFDGNVSFLKLQKKHLAMLKPELPQKLALAKDLKVQHLKSGEVLLTAYSELDAIALSETAYELLNVFDGQADVAATRARLRKEKQTDFADEVLMMLYQHRVLTAD